MLSERWDEKLDPDVISYSVGISAWEQGAQWQRALALLCEMWESKLHPNVISCSAGTGACEKDMPWQRALADLGVLVGAISYSAGTGTCEKGRLRALATRRHQLQR